MTPPFPPPPPCPTTCHSGGCGRRSAADALRRRRLIPASHTFETTVLLIACAVAFSLPWSAIFRPRCAVHRLTLRYFSPGASEILACRPLSTSFGADAVRFFLGSTAQLQA